MEQQEKIKILTASIKEMAQYTYPYLASVLGVVDAQRGQHVGSGLRCQIGGKKTLITASHVQIATEAYGSAAVSAGPEAAPVELHGSVHADARADIAVYALPPEYPIQPGTVEFWPESRIEASMENLSTDYLFVHGFPQARSRFLSLLGGVVSKSFPYGVMRRLDDLPEDLQPFQFAVDFDPGHMRLTDDEDGEIFVDPHGLSGAPVWRIGVSGRRTSTWSPDDSLLVGLITQWRPGEKLLVGTFASAVLACCREVIY